MAGTLIGSFICDRVACSRANGAAGVRQDTRSALGGRALADLRVEVQDDVVSSGAGQAGPLSSVASGLRRRSDAAELEGSEPDVPTFHVKHSPQRRLEFVGGCVFHVKQWPSSPMLRLTESNQTKSQHFTSHDRT
jgi:hypothetical protein